MEKLITVLPLFSAGLSLLSLLSAVFGVLFMHYSAKHRNYRLGTGWYVCGVLFGFWTVLVFLLKRKDFPGADQKVCWQCGVRYPSNFQVCSNCVIDLPQINTEEKQKEKRISRVFGVLLAVVYLLAFAAGIVWGATVAKYVADAVFSEESYRISVNGVFYDKKGNFYEDENSVVMYDEDGYTYTYSEETYTDEDGFEYEEYYYIRNDGEKYFEMDCYITADGWFYCDKAGLLELYAPDTGSMTEEELDEYYKNSMDEYNAQYRYYDYPYVDSDGNFYYDIYEASWNENGELITAENDMSI